MAKNRLPSKEVLTQMLSYDRETGNLHWLHRPVDMFANSAHSAAHTCAKWNSRMAGKPALNSKHGAGYRHGAIFGVDALAHRVAWKIETGEEPDQIDHIDGDRANNRFSNLRGVSSLENNRNAARHVDNISGHTGVRETKSGKWQAYITVDYREVMLGTYIEIDDAMAVRKDAERKYGFHENHGRVAV